MRRNARESLMKRDVRAQGKQRHRETPKRDRVNEFTFTARIHCFFLNSHETHGTVQRHASPLLEITTVACYIARHKSSHFHVFLHVCVCVYV